MLVSILYYPPLPPSYHRDLKSILWPRFRHILALNVGSIKNTDPSKLGNIDTRPHYVSEPLKHTYTHL